MNLYPVVILAGGTATRLRPITEKMPKALVRIGDQPFIYHQLRLLQSRGARRVVLCVWYRGELIRDFVGDGSQFGLKVECAFDGETPLGTAGAIRRALHLLESPFFVLYGDSFLPCDYAAIQGFFDRHKEPALMTVYRNQGKWDTSNVDMANGRIISYDKKKHDPRMEYIDYGLGLFHPETFLGLESGQVADLADTYASLAAQGGLLAYEVKDRFYEIGSLEGLRELDALIAENPNRFLARDEP
jgi:NDP-sugar pyrophosphorylase family protein